MMFQRLKVRIICGFAQLQRFGVTIGVLEGLWYSRPWVVVQALPGVWRAEVAHELQRAHLGEQFGAYPLVSSCPLFDVIGGVLADRSTRVADNPEITRAGIRSLCS
jgi:hypothetical protein